ncbi:MAG: hypothetical protein GY926_13440 [bacterium]|nr:hypothetical protein [bacterium]
MTVSISRTGLTPAAPDANPFPKSTATIAELRYSSLKVALGKTLFWEEQVSSDNTMACGTCHFPSSGGSDQRTGPLSGGLGGAFGMIRQHQSGPSQLSYGHVNPGSSNIDRLATGRFPPTMIGAYAFNLQFWDLRAGPGLDVTNGSVQHINGFRDWAGLEDQVTGPPVSDVEMGHEGIDWTANTIQAKLGASRPMALVDPTTIPASIQSLVSTNLDYDALFDQVFQSDSDSSIAAPQGVSRTRFAMAIAAYERTLIPDGAPIDTATMTTQQTNGFNRMRLAGCFACHSITGTQSGLDALGLPVPAFNQVTGQLANAFDNVFADGDEHNINSGSGSVKTPTLRNLGLRTRFFANGQMPDINALIDFYDQQPPPLGFPGTLGPIARANVIDFLTNALTDPRVANQTFPFDRPQLASERPEFVFEANEFGNGTAGPSGLVPEIIANMPPLVLPNGSTAVNWFKVGVGNTVPNARTALLVSNVQGTGPVLWVGNPFVLVAVPSANANGIATAQLPFLLDTASIGVDVFVQFIIDDNGVRASSNAATFRPFQF